VLPVLRLWIGIPAPRRQVWLLRTAHLASAPPLSVALRLVRRKTPLPRPQNTAEQRTPSRSRLALKINLAKSHSNGLLSFRAPQVTMNNAECPQSQRQDRAWCPLEIERLSL
jgi:hypothetical protein